MIRVSTLAFDKLSPLQRTSLNKTMQAAFDRAAATLALMLGGEVSLALATRPLRCPGVCVRLGLAGALEGGIYVDLPEKMALALVRKLTSGGEPSLLAEASRSVLMELGNILASVFVAYFDQYRGLRTLPTPPELSLVPFDVPDFAATFCAEFRWNNCREQGSLLVGLDDAALAILLAG